MKLAGYLFQNPRFYSSQPSKPEVANYTPRLDLEHVRRIAIKHMPQLVSVSSYTQEHYAQLFQSQVMPILDNPEASRKVVRNNSSAVGFINYHITPRWYGNFGRIEHLALDSHFQKSGHGTMLMQHAIDELRRKNVHVVHLTMTEDEVVGFYQKFGFKVTKHVNLKFQAAGEMALLLNRAPGKFGAPLDMLRVYKNLLPRYVGMGAFTLFATYVSNKS